MICAARESGAKRTDKGTAGESRCRKATGLNSASRTTAGPPNTKPALPRVQPDERKDFL